MSDPNLLVFGCGVSFIAVAGIYVFIRERYMEAEREAAESDPGDPNHEARPVA